MQRAQGRPKAFNMAPYWAASQQAYKPPRLRRPGVLPGPIPRPPLAQLDASGTARPLTESSQVVRRPARRFDPTGWSDPTNHAPPNLDGSSYLGVWSWRTGGQRGSPVRVGPPKPGIAPWLRLSMPCRALEWCAVAALAEAHRVISRPRVRAERIAFAPIELPPLLCDARAARLQSVAASRSVTLARL